MPADPTTLNPTDRRDQFTAFVLMPVCLRCGYAGLSVRRNGQYHCDGCHRAVTTIEYAPTMPSRRPLGQRRLGG